MKGTAKIENAIVEIPYCIPEPLPEGRTMIQHVGIVGIVTFLVSAIVASFWLIGKGTVSYTHLTLPTILLV